MEKKILDKSEVLKLSRAGMTGKDIAAKFGVTPVYISNLLKKLRADAPPESVTNLTEKQQVFVRAKVEGMTSLAAANVAFDCKSDQVARNYGSQLMQDPDIKLAVSDLLAQVGMTKRRRAELLSDHAESPDRAASLKSIDLMYKLEGAYAAEEKVITVDVNVLTASLQEVTERMMKLGFFNADVIDLTPEIENVPAIQRECEENVNSDVPLAKAPDMRAITLEYKKSLVNIPDADFIPPWELDKKYVPEKTSKSKPKNNG